MSESADQLKKQIADSELQLAQYRTQLTDEHPRVQALKDNIDQAKAALGNLPADTENAGDPGSAGALPGTTSTQQPATVAEPKSPLVQFIVGGPTRSVTVAPKVKERIYTPPTEDKSVLPPPPIPQSPAATHGVALHTPETTPPPSPVTVGAMHASPTVQTPAMHAWLFPLIALSLLLAFIIALLIIKRQSNRITHPNQVLEILHLPILGWINQMPTARRSGEILPGIHRVRSNLIHNVGSQPHEIIITSPDPGDGKTILSAALALNFAESGVEVTLVDANPMNPSLASFFCCDTMRAPASDLGAPGTCPLGTPGSSPAQPSHFQETKVKHNLRVITYGGTIDSNDFKNLREYIRQTSKVILYDCAALREDTSSLLLTDKDTPLIVVARINHTNFDSLELTASYLRQYRVKTAALAFFDAPERAMIKTQYQTHLQPMH